MPHRFGTWKPAVPPAQRRAQAVSRKKKAGKGGRTLQPLDLQGRPIAKSFWGKGWCKHLETFSDFENRLPRGRSYVRNGSVLHLKVDPGRIEALVMGSSLYEVSVEIAPLQEASWNVIKQKCTGQIGSMLELLQGRFSSQVMAVVTARESGLFPQPGEMRFDCGCPDWASLCKHTAAALYGVGSLLDLQPELLFMLRQVDAGELVGAELSLPSAEGSSQHQLPDDQLAAIFGIDFDSGFDTIAPVAAFKATAKSVAALRKKLGLSAAEFAVRLSVSPGSIHRWEAGSGELKLHRRCLAALAALQGKGD